MWHVSIPVAVWQPCELLYTCYLLTYLPAQKRSAQAAVKRSKMSLIADNRDLRRRCSLLAKPELLRDMERTIEQRRRTSGRVDQLQAAYAHVDERTRVVTGKIRAAERRKAALDRY